MKKLFMIACIIIGCFEMKILLSSFNSSLILFSEIDMFAYSNEPPGGEGERRTQAVQCGVGGWKIKPGCCYGWSDCDWMNPCNGASFSCDGKRYVLPIVGGRGDSDDILDF